MMSSFKAELRKLITIRSTYIMVLVGVLLISFVSFWVEGYKGVSGSPASLLSPDAVVEIIGQSAGLGVVFTLIIAILFTAHEYRYNTIMYTLTANVRRTRVLLTKLITVALFSIFLGAIFVATGLTAYYSGLSWRDATLPAQQIDVLSTVGKLLFYFAGYALLGTLVAVVTRSVIAAISIMLIFPSIVEPLLGLLLKENAKYLPITALDSTMGTSLAQAPLSSGTAIAVSCVYLLVGFVVTWFLFTKRDAN